MHQSGLNTYDLALVEAERLVETGQDEANHYGTKFSRANLAAYRVSVPVELADGTTAVARAAQAKIPATMAPSRRSHYWIDVARGLFLHGDRTKTLEALREARRISPQVTKYHPQVHETVHALAARDVRATGSLHEFADWCGIRH